jgi:polyketide synthase PksM
VLSARHEDRLKQVAANLHHALCDGAVSRDLASIAYTLQVGREAMDERLAFMASSLDELKAGLQAFLLGEDPHGETLYRGQVDRHKETLALFAADEDMATAIDAWITKGKYEKLLELWVKGLNIDWHKLYGASGSRHGPPRRISLPTYPFARERYWLEGLDLIPMERGIGAPDPAANPHPLTHENAPDRVEQRSHSRLTGTDGSRTEQTLPSANGTHASAVTDAAETYMLIPAWSAVPTAERDDDPSPADRVLIVGGTVHQRAVLRRIYPEADVLDLHEGDEIEAIGARLAAVEPIRHILVLTPQPEFVSAADDTLIQEQERGVLLVFRLIKALLARGHGGRDLDWTLVTTMAQAIHARDPVNPAHAALYGLAGSMAKEYPHWRTRLIDLEYDDNWGEPDGPAPVIDEMLHLPPDEDGNAWAYRGAEWFRQELIPVRDLAAAGQIYRENGVYVVIGGAGGLGTIWSRFMIETHGAQIIWIGRRPEDAEIQAKLDDLARLGPPPVYLSADATDRDALQRAYNEIKRRHPRIHGVIHAAIVLQDKGLAGMDETRFRAGLAAKVDVCVRLAQVFEQEDLDFTLFFSSAQSFSKSPGQSNYAAGCIFKDAFARALSRHWRGRVKVMNWGYWGHAGIVSSPEYQERMQQAGVGSIEPEEGMAALDALLNGSMDQVVLMKMVTGAIHVQ